MNITQSEFQKWMQAANPGDEIVYYSGEETLMVMALRDPKIRGIRDLAWDLCAPEFEHCCKDGEPWPTGGKGMGYLVQRRNPVGMDYIAIKK